MDICFRTRAGFSISLEMKSEASEYNWVPVAAIYDGEAVDEKRMLAQFNTIRADRGAQVRDKYTVLMIYVQSNRFRKNLFNRMHFLVEIYGRSFSINIYTVI